jgi:probable HAF family extracellular repeat protein
MPHSAHLPLAAVFVTVCTLAQAEPQFYGIGHIPPHSDSRITGLGLDGIAAGYTSSPGGPPRYSVRWSPAAGLQQISPTPSYATAITPDGQTIVGSMSNSSSSHWEAFRWRTSIGAEFLGNLSSWWPSGTSKAVSADGETIVGYASISNFHTRAFRWTKATGMQNLGTLPNLIDPGSEANAVSADGAVIVGASSLGITLATRWDSSGISSLGTIPGAPSQWSIARGINGEGSVVVGQSNSPGDIYQAFRWSVNGMLGLGMLPGAESSAAIAVSYDGRIIVGWSGPRSTLAGRTATLWTPSGTRSLHAELTTLGITAHEGWILREAVAISPDAKWIGGSGINPQGQVEGWVAYVGGIYCYANCDGSITAPALNIADFTCFLQKFAAGDPYANCDGSTTEPILNIADFTCFLSQFAAGC